MEVPEGWDLLLQRVYNVVKDGFAMALVNMLSDKSLSQINLLINQKVFKSGGQCYTPLIVAALHGRDKVVRTLVDKFDPDLEEEGAVEFDGYIIEGVSALWCAAGAGHLNVVKTLVKAGADVNHATKTNSTPLRAACFDGRLDIVKYLTEHKADIHVANKFNNTCLMIAAYKGHLDVVTYLLEQGIDPNATAHCGATALHYASESGHASIVYELFLYGSRMTKNVSGMTPLMVAAERTHEKVVECIVKDVHVSRREAVEAYELLGASFANDRDNYCLRRSYEYLHKGMEIRFNDPEDIIKKEPGNPVKAYENWRECETLDQLESINNNPNALHMESLAIRERILGPHNPEVPQPIIFRGAVFADNARFDRCVDLWLHALTLRQSNKVSLVKDLLRFAQVFSQMIHVGVDLDFTQVLSVLSATVTELSRNKAKIENPDMKDDVDQHIAEMESNITTTLYILMILAKLLTLHGSQYAKQDVTRAHHLVQKLCALELRLRDGQSLLHLAVNANTSVDDFHTSDVCKFPCAATANLLVKCGADVNAMDNERNTPLHVIVSYEKTVSDFITLNTIMLDLIKAGAHMDTVNSSGKTPYDSVETGIAEMILWTQTKPSLKCLAAKVVKAYNLSYCGNVPRCLESFIELHGPGP